MDRLKKNFDHEISLKNIEINSPSEKLLRDKGSPYLYIDKKNLKLDEEIIGIQAPSCS